MNKTILSKNYILLILLVITSVAKAQWVGTGNIYYNGGNVGIGTDAPSTRLHIKGDDPDIALDINSSSTVANMLELRFNVDGVERSSIFYTKANNQLFLRNNSHNVVLSETGFFGIGTTVPGEKLELYDGRMKINSNAVVMEFYERDNNKKWFLIGDGNNFRISQNSTSSSDNAFFIGQNKRIGIGTSSPDSKLTVKGDIHAEGVKVNLNVPGPDYVFEQDYSLPTLESIQQYVQENKHLPEIPSAAEMEKEGIDLGTMNMMLLKKVEELTLHLIKQNERIKELENKLSN